VSTPHKALDELIASERAQMVPPDGAAPAGWAELERRLADGAKPVVDASPPSAAGSGIGKVAIGLAVLGLIVLAFGTWRTKDDAPDREVERAVQTEASAAGVAPADPQKPRAPAPPEEAPAQGEAEPPAEPAAEDPPPTQDKTPRAANRTSGKKAENAGSMEDELKLLEQAKAALNRDDGTGALALLAKHKREFPRGLFVEERKAMRVEALCAAGRKKDGTRERTRFLDKYPRSPFIDRVKGACN
jgi:type IV secretory pathway VirB10-like protein